jgi:PAS domain S-box-containing protein
MIKFLDPNIPKDMSMQAYYDPALVLFSLLIIIMAAFAGIAVINQIRASDSRAKRYAWLAFGSIILGSGIFAMNFIGMAAYNLPIPVSYDFLTLALSILPAIFSSFIILYFISLSSKTLLQRLISALALSAAINLMRYTVIMALRLEAVIMYDFHIFCVSIIASIVLSMTALNVDDELSFLHIKQDSILGIASAPILLGLSISGAHYIAMKAVYFIPFEYHQFNVSSELNTVTFSVTISIMIIIMSITALFFLYINKQRTLDKENLEMSANGGRIQLRDRFLRIFLPIVLIILFAYMSLFHYHVLSNNLDLKTKTMTELELASNKVSGDFDATIFNANFILKGLVSSKDLINQNRDDAQYNFSKFIKNLVQEAGVYSSISLIDEKGMERIKVERINDQAVIVPSVSLKLKSNENYFKEASKLGNGEFFVSRFEPMGDLPPFPDNVQIEIPSNPIIRFACPIFDLTGKRRGVIVINYLMINILNEIRDAYSKSTSAVYVVDDDGILQQTPSTKEESAKRGLTTAESFPQIYGMTEGIDKGQFEVGGKIFTFNKIYEIPSLLDSYQHYQQRSFQFTFAHIKKKNYIMILTVTPMPAIVSLGYIMDHPIAVTIFIGLLILAGFLSWIIAHSMVERDIAETKMKDSIKELNFQKFALDEHAIVSATDIDGTIIYVNDKFCKISGYNCEELIGGNYRITSSGEHSREFIENLWQTITQGNTWHGEIKHRNKDGGFFWVNATIVPFLDKYGFPFQFITICTDITERKRIEEELAIMNASLGKQVDREVQSRLEKEREKNEAVDANRAKSEFIANMSHEIRTPMNAIMGFSELIYTNATDKKQLKYAQSINSACKSLLTLINDILDLSKIEAGKMAIESVPVNISSLLNEINLIFTTIIAEKGVDFIIDIAPDIPESLMMDETRLRQILFNLVGNALKFIKKGYIKILANKINLSDDPNKIGLSITVEDTGIGIPPDSIDMIFDAFNQVGGQSTREYGGTGLGLTISKRLAKMMNGDITVKSAVGVGSVFEILIRDIKVSNAKAVNVVDYYNEDYNNTIFEESLILIIDDIESNRDLVIEYLSGTNITVIQAENGQQGIEAALKYRPDVILMDIKMPQMDGYEAARLIKKEPSLRGIPIIALTASIMKEEIKQYQQFGFDALIQKPVNRAYLFKKIQLFIGHTMKIVEEKAEEALSPEVIKNIPEILSRINNGLIILWRSAKDSNNINIINEFASKVKEIGEQYSLRILQDYGSNLTAFADNFDVENMNKTLEGFSKTIEIINDWAM